MSVSLYELGAASLLGLGTTSSSLVGAALGLYVRFSQKVLACRMAAAEWRNLVQQISRALASERRNREAIEKELFHGEYMRVSKNDDDLPVPYLVARVSVDCASEKQGES